MSDTKQTTLDYFDLVHSNLQTFGPVEGLSHGQGLGYHSHAGDFEHGCWNSWRTALHVKPVSSWSSWYKLVDKWFALPPVTDEQLLMNALKRQTLLTCAYIETSAQFLLQRSITESHDAWLDLLFKLSRVCSDLPVRAKVWFST